MNDPRLRRSRRIFLWVSGLAAVAFVVVANAVLLPFALGLVVAFVLTPAVLRVERLGIPRWVAILLVYALSLSLVSGFVALTVPSLVAEGVALRRELPNTLEHVRTEVLPAIDARIRSWTGQKLPPPAAQTGPAAPEQPPAPIRIVRVDEGTFDVELRESVVFKQVGENTWRIEPIESDPPLSSEALVQRAFDRATAWVTTNTVELLRIGQRVVSAISRGVFYLFLTLMIGGYVIYTHERIIAFLRDLIPLESQTSFDRLIRRLDRGLAGVLRGQLIICVVNGVLSAIGFWFFGLKYWPLMALIAAVGSIIPIFGSILSTIPAVAIGLTQSPGTAFAVLAWVVGIHQLEANFLNPKIIGDAAKIHPVLVVFSLLVGEHFFQIKGALLAVPCLSIVQTLFLHFRETTMGLADPLASIPPTPASALALETPIPGSRAAKPTTRERRPP